MSSLLAVDSTRENGHSRGDGVTWVGQVSILAILYVAMGHFGLEFAHYHDIVSLVWPPTGLALAALILFGRRLWPGIFIGTLLLNLTNDVDLGWLLFAATGSVLEAVVGVTLLVRVAGLQPTLARMRDVAAFLLLGVVGCTTVGATIGTFSLLVFGSVETANFLPVWLIWWLGDMGGALILTPILLMLVHGTPAWGSLFRSLECWLALAFLLAATSLAFSRPMSGAVGFTLLLPCFPFWSGREPDSVRAGPHSLRSSSS